MLDIFDTGLNYDTLVKKMSQNCRGIDMNDLNRLFTAQTRVSLLNSDGFFYVSQFKRCLQDEFCHT